jgi:glycosyltransferase involved in cell wall biosynthesis
MTDPNREPIAYLTSEYDAPSHTFIRREVAALRALGLSILTYSVHATPSNSQAGSEVGCATYYLLSQPYLTYFKAHLVALGRHPLRYLQTLLLALRHRVPGARALLWSFFHFAEAIVLARRLERDGVLRLHNHFANPAATVGFLAARYLRLPWSFTIHGISEFDYPAGLLLADKIAAATFVPCASRFVMAQAMRLADPCQWGKFKLVRCGIEFAGLPAAHDTGREGPAKLICVARLSPEKGHAGLLDAIAQLRARGNALHLTLIGDGPEEIRLRRQCASLGLDDLVSFPGRLAEAATLNAIATSDLLVLPSFMEGLPVVLVEAMAIGVPVVASNVAGIPELVINDESGLLVVPADGDALVLALERLIQDADLRAALSGAARRRVAEEFSIENAVLPLLVLFKDGEGVA